MKEMNESTHIFVLFPCSAQYKQDILRDLRTRFRVFCIYELNWSDECYRTNYHRLFLERYACSANWIKECGVGTITCVVIVDDNPIYARRKTTVGFEIVNENVYILEKEYQEWVGNPHGVFVSLHERESTRTSLLLLHRQLDDLRNSEMQGEQEAKSLFQDLPGAKQWNNLQDLFYFLDAVSDYVVWDWSEDGFSYKILIRAEYAILSSVLNVSAKTRGKRRSYVVNVGGRSVDLEFWNVVYDYFDAKWVDAAFETKQHVRGFWVVNSEHAFYLYIYESIFHQRMFGEDMALKADILWETYRSESLSNISPGAQNRDQYWFMLNHWMNERGYHFVRHYDSSLVFNAHILELGKMCKILHNVAGFRDVRPIMVNQYGGGGYKYFLGYEGDKKMFIKWGGIGNSALTEYETTRMLYSQCPDHVPKPGFFSNNPFSKFYAMEYLEGKSLRNLMDAGSLAEEDKISVTHQLERLSSMLYASKILHRDVRPENLYITQNGVLKLIDCQWSVRYDAYSEMTQVLQNPRLIRKLGDKYAVAKFVWDDHYSINLIMDELLGPDDCSAAHVAVRERIGKQQLRFFEPTIGMKTHQGMQPKILYELHREWLQEYGNEEQVYQLDRDWLNKTSDAQAVYLLDKAWLEKHGDKAALYQLEKAWLEKTADEKAVYLLDKAWLEKNGDEMALYKLNRAWLEKTADEKDVYLLDKAWLEKRGDEAALYKLNRAWLAKTSDEKAVYLLDKAWLEKREDEEALYKLNRAWLEKTADEKDVYLLDKAWLEKRGDEEALYRLNRAWLEKTADEKDVYLLDKAWLEKRGEKDAIYLHEKAWLAKHGTREEQYRHERKHLISIREDKQKLYQLDCEWLRSNKDYDSLHRLEKDWLIAHKASADEIFELDCKWYQQTGKIAEWYNLKKSRLLRIGSLREIRTFENTHEIRRRSYLRIGKWLYLRRRWQGNTRQVVLRIGRREWILFKVHKRTIN